MKAVRDGETSAGALTALHAAAAHVDADGRPLPARIAAVELLNVLRPTVAVALYIVFAAHALQVNREWREGLRGADGQAFEWFVQEVRRHYPFFPAVVARVRKPFEWNGWHFTAGRRAMLGPHETNHDPRSWTVPQTFRPERFGERTPGACEFIAQGGGDAATHHRCPGEALAAALMKEGLRFLLDELDFEWVARDLALDVRRLPALPREGLWLRVRAVRHRGDGSTDG